MLIERPQRTAKRPRKAGVSLWRAINIERVNLAAMMAVVGDQPHAL